MDRMKRKLLPYALVAPALIIYLTFSLIPLLGVFKTSLYKTNFIRTEFVGLKNYVRLLTDDTFLGSLYNSFLYTILGVPLHLFVAVGVALLIYNTSDKWQTYAKTAIYLPGFIGAIILASVWRWVWNRNGLVNGLLGLDMSWFASRWTSIPPLVLSSTVIGFGGSLVIISAGLASVPKESIDAAMVDGARWWQIKLRILLPAIYKIVILISLLQTAATFMLFYWIELLAPYDYAGTLMWVMYKTAFRYSKYGRGSAYAVVLMFIIIAVAMVQRRVMRGKRG
jgi:ABC-type sugar transport system permease subunit